MKITSTYIGYLAICLAQWAACQPLPIAQSKWHTDLQTTQIVVVLTPSETATTGVLRVYEWRKTGWLPRTGFLRAKVGRNGLAWANGLQAQNFNTPPLKQEGDGKAPQGLFRLTQTFGYAETAIHKKMPYIALNTPNMLCIDDSQSAQYTQIVNSTTAKKDYNSAETMRRPDSLYEYGVVVDYNQTNTQKGAGSCIFMHVAMPNGAPTAGCTALTKSDLLQVIHALDSTKKPLLLQCTHANYAALARELGLPKDWAIIN